MQASKEYYAGAYIQLCGSIKQALRISEDVLQQYIQDFHSQVDHSHNARLDADGIYDLDQKINGFENRMENLTAEISAINGTQKASELNYLATQIFEAHKKEEILAKYLDFERSHANFFRELGELAHCIKQALRDIQKNIRFDRATGTYGVDKLNPTNFKELSRLYASQQAIDDKIKEIEDIGLTPVIPNGNSAGFMMHDGHLNTTATLGFVNEQMIYWQNESTFRELFLVGSSYRVLYGIDAVTGQHVTDSRLAFDLLVLASSAFGVKAFTTRAGVVRMASFDKNVVLRNIEESKAARESSNFSVYATKEKIVLQNAEANLIPKSKPMQMHHYATNKSKTYTHQMENVTKKYGLDLDESWNKELLPHQGRHPNAYHEYVLDKLNTYDAIAQGDRELFLELYEELKFKIRVNPDMLYKEYWLNLK
nr:AHH domain-containing protein [Listeria cornellensis]